MGAQIKPPPGTGPYCYRIHGQIYHMVSPLYSDHNKPGYGQFYVFDPSTATEKRMERNEGYLPSVMERLDSVLRAINPVMECYLQMHRIIEENPAANIRMVFMENGNLDLRRYNQPTSKTEIAAIFVGDNGEPPANRDICIYPVDGRYVSAPEAKWLLNESNLSEKSHTVVRLAVHLPDQQAIVYQDGQEEEAIARAATRQTTLTVWFELNKNDQDSHNYLYTDIPHYYTFNKSAMKWQKRQ
ncbi:hypothetical protein AVEN_90955-1 [Araneus ventricosus]|uniref:Helitron helicase-like domain-containing protein n=1 Tax=Araneus ventricosus TaxID=182803 RepID=A0A4Y2GY04_ARAVE|nr:hypothetical protein AVEN_90955-1 [Araneus ventricosus]